MTEPVASFEGHLAREIIHSERMRMAIRAGLLGALIVFFGLFYALFYKGSRYLQRFLTPVPFFYIIAVIALLLGYELAVRHMIGRWLRQGRGVPSALRYLNAFVETSVPSILILLVSREINPVYVLQSAAGFLYAVFIVLSTLRLDFRLSVFTGMVAALRRARRSRRRRSTWARGRCCSSPGSPRASSRTSSNAVSATLIGRCRSASAS